MKTIRYQQEYVKKLVDDVTDLLQAQGQRRSLVFKSPTGAGKTVMAAETLRTLTLQLAAGPTAPCHEVAYMWIAPNKLHEQSYFKMKNAFTETRELKPVIFDELDHSPDGCIQPGEILFVNWESINSEKNLLVRDTEQQASLYDLTHRTQVEHGIPLVVIIDEEHMFSGKSANKSAKVLEKVNAKVEIRISATPQKESRASANKYEEVPREKVIAEQMIKEGVTLNPALELDHSSNSLDLHLLQRALAKRKELAEAYKALGEDINPLLLIQLPNDGEKMDATDNEVREEVTTYLNAMEGITAENGRLAVWLSNEKTDNLRTIAQNNDLTEVLLFKQAIALGWDCPRAAVLLIYRKNNSITFTAQTVGRILRMPQQKYYSDARLNRGYVYTDLSADAIQIVQDDMDYITTLYAKRREDLCNISLKSVYSERPAAVRNRIGSDFRQVLTHVLENKWGVNGNVRYKQIPLFADDEDTEDHSISLAAKNREAAKGDIEFNVSSVAGSVVENVENTGEVGITQVKTRAKFARTMNELDDIFTTYCAKRLGGNWEKASIRILANAIKDVMEDVWELFENDAVKVVLYHANQERFSEVIDRALARCCKILAQRQQERQEAAYKDCVWEVPAERYYNEHSHHTDPKVEKHALLPFVELNNASNPELRFKLFLEQHSDAIDWWYKNGDNGKMNYAVPYETEQGKALFYVDYIIRMKNGQVFLFDTKSAGSDGYAPEKHNALLDYMASPENNAQHLKGGVLIEDKDLWYYSPLKINTTENHDGWSVFHPADYK